MNSCKICGNKMKNRLFLIREMMLGLREEFEYIQCNDCGCLQLVEAPSDLAKYYPSDYYSFTEAVNENNFIKNYLSGLRDSYSIDKSPVNVIGNILNRIKPASSFIRMLSELPFYKTSRILDVGSGNGGRIIPISLAGFNIQGIDAYIKKNVIKIGRLKIFKKDLFEVEGKWDIIMLNHVFEHLENPLRTIEKIEELLETNGRCLIRTPIIPSFAWEKYKTNWVQLDAPRHLFIHSIDSIKILLNATGLKIEKVIYDSTPFQFLGSELYKENIPIKDGDFRLNKNNRFFTLDEIHSFIKKTKELNENERGDQVALILRKKDINE